MCSVGLSAIEAFQPLLKSPLIVSVSEILCPYIRHYYVQCGSSRLKLKKLHDLLIEMSFVDIIVIWCQNSASQIASFPGIDFVVVDSYLTLIHEISTFQNSPTLKRPRFILQGNRPGEDLPFPIPLINFDTPWRNRVGTPPWSIVISLVDSVYNIETLRKMDYRTQELSDVSSIFR